MPRWHHFEHKSEPLVGGAVFAQRMVRCSVAAGILVLGSLLLGIVGYRAFEHLDWIDAFLNAAMLLGGMGPVNSPQSVAGKLFAGFYALYCGLVVILVTGIVLAPLAHRMLHRFHLETRG
jgi:hypothetical protein